MNNERVMNMNQTTEIIFLLDRSGSMSGLEEDTIGGFNTLVKKQSEEEGRTVVTAVLFDNNYEMLWDGVEAGTVVLTKDNYFVRGSTALLDAIGRTITTVSTRINNTEKENRPNKVLFVITTDGYENASQEYSYKKVKKLIKKHEDKHHWEFLFIGANLDVAKEATSLGISVEDAIIFDATGSGVEKMYSQVSEELVRRRQFK